MKHNRLSFLSVFVVLGVLPYVADGAIRIGASNSSDTTARANRAGGYYTAQTYNQQATQAIIQQSQPVTSADLPIPVENEQIAQQIINADENATVTVETLEKCSLLYPGGEFEWARPTIGMSAGGAPTCVAVVELRDTTKKDAAGRDTVIARARLAAGETIKCNVSEFPESAFMPNLGEIVVPADTEPTIEDVIAVMNEEQKQNAAVKIIGGTVIAGLAGNLLGKSEPGSDSMFGGGKDKVTSTVASALGGAALMTASTYSGKVAGDMIMSAGVNAAAGAVVGNTVAKGKSVMRIERCTVDGRETTCLWGTYEEKAKSNDGTTDKAYYVEKSSANKFVKCYKKTNDTEGKVICDPVRISKSSIKISEYYSEYDRSTNTLMDFEDIVADKFALVKEHYCYKNGNMEKKDEAECTDGTIYIKLDVANEVEKSIPAMIADIEDTAFGYKKEDWETTVKNNMCDPKKIVGRTGTGKATRLAQSDSKSELTCDNFIPTYTDADEGDIIDMGNKARLTGTLTGAGVGAGAGAFSAYQGAQTEIDQRWVTAVREYKDSLQKIYCGTGTKFMSFYNDVVMVPVLQ